MKKLLPGLVILLALGAAGATVFLLQKPGAGGASASVAAGYLPAESLLLLSVPDPQQSAADWKTTDLYKIWTEPSVQAFFAKPLSKLPVNKDFNDTLAQIERVGPRNLFVALTALDEKNNEPHMVAGFQFKGSGADVETLLSKPKEALRQSSPAGKADLVKYQEHSVETFTTEQGKTVASVVANDWYFVSNDLALLEATLDRVEHRAPASQPTLESDADFKATLAKMPASPATLIFAKPRVFFDRIFTLAATSGQSISDEQLVEVRKLKAVAATTTFDHGKLRDTIYVLAPGHRQPGGLLQMSALPLTSLDTLAFYASVLDLPEKIDVPTKPAGASPSAMGYAILGQYANKLSEQGITWENFRAAFGREMSVQLDWPSGSPQPSLVYSLDVRDPAAAGKFVEAVLKAVPDDYAKITTPTSTATVGSQAQNASGVMYRTLAVPNVPFLSPTLAVTDKHFLLGLSFDGVRNVVGHEKTPGANFTGSDSYKAAAATVAKPTLVTAYIDAKPLFERTYSTLKPLAMFGAAFAGPQINDTVDFTKLPDGDAIAKHLTPIVLSEQSDEQGTLIESVGPVTAIQATAGLSVVVGAAVIPAVQKQIAAATGHSDEPEPTPEATPQPTAGE